MVYLPEELQRYIFSFLPIVSNEKKQLNLIVKNYHLYFEREFCKILRFNFIYRYWLKTNQEIRLFLETNPMTMIQLQKLYTFSTEYGELIDEEHSL